MTDEPTFLDSFAPYDGEVCTDEAWPLPAVKPLEGKFDQPQPASLWERLHVWLGGAA